MYKLLLEKKVEKELEPIPDNFLKKIDAKILSLAQEPRPRDCKKLEGIDGYRVRVGNYRILYTIDDKNRVVSIYRVKGRKEAY